MRRSVTSTRYMPTLVSQFACRDGSSASRHLHIVSSTSDAACCLNCLVDAAVGFRDQEKADTFAQLLHQLLSLVLADTSVFAQADVDLALMCADLLLAAGLLFEGVSSVSKVLHELLAALHPDAFVSVFLWSIENAVGGRQVCFAVAALLEFTGTSLESCWCTFSTESGRLTSRCFTVLVACCRSLLHQDGDADAHEDISDTIALCETLLFLAVRLATIGAPFDGSALGDTEGAVWIIIAIAARYYLKPCDITTNALCLALLLVQPHGSWPQQLQGAGANMWYASSGEEEYARLLLPLLLSRSDDIVAAAASIVARLHAIAPLGDELMKEVCESAFEAARVCGDASCPAILELIGAAAATQDERIPRTAALVLVKLCLENQRTEMFADRILPAPWFRYAAHRSAADSFAQQSAKLLRVLPLQAAFALLELVAAHPSHRLTGESASRLPVDTLSLLAHSTRCAVETNGGLANALRDSPRQLQIDAMATVVWLWEQLNGCCSMLDLCLDGFELCQQMLAAEPLGQDIFDIAAQVAGCVTAVIRDSPHGQLLDAAQRMVAFSARAALFSANPVTRVQCVRLLDDLSGGGLLIGCCDATAVSQCIFQVVSQRRIDHAETLDPTAHLFDACISCSRQLAACMIRLMFRLSRRGFTRSSSLAPLVSKWLLHASANGAFWSSTTEATSCQLMLLRVAHLFDVTVVEEDDRCGWDLQPTCGLWSATEWDSLLGSSPLDEHWCFLRYLLSSRLPTARQHVPATLVAIASFSMSWDVDSSSAARLLEHHITPRQCEGLEGALTQAVRMLFTPSLPQDETCFYRCARLALACLQLYPAAVGEVCLNELLLPCLLTTPWGTRDQVNALGTVAQVALCARSDDISALERGLMRWSLEALARYEWVDATACVPALLLANLLRRFHANEFFPRAVDALEKLFTEFDSPVEALRSAPLELWYLLFTLHSVCFANGMTHSVASGKTFSVSIQGVVVELLARGVTFLELDRLHPASMVCGIVVSSSDLASSGCASRRAMVCGALSECLVRQLMTFAAETWVRCSPSEAALLLCVCCVRRHHSLVHEVVILALTHKLHGWLVSSPRHSENVQEVFWLSAQLLRQVFSAVTPLWAEYSFGSALMSSFCSLCDSKAPCDRSPLHVVQICDQGSCFPVFL